MVTACPHCTAMSFISSSGSGGMCNGSYSDGYTDWDHDYDGLIKCFGCNRVFHIQESGETHHPKHYKNDPQEEDWFTKNGKRESDFKKYINPSQQDLIDAVKGNYIQQDCLKYYYLAIWEKFHHRIRKDAELYNKEETFLKYPHLERDWNFSRFTKEKPGPITNNADEARIYNSCAGNLLKLLDENYYFEWMPIVEIYRRRRAFDQALEVLERLEKKGSELEFIEAQKHYCNKKSTALFTYV